MENIFEKLLAVDVSAHIEKKGQYSYLSWPWAVAELRKVDPKADWAIHNYPTADGCFAPFMKTDCGTFVKVSVTVGGVKLSQVHPVLDNKNKTIQKPNAFDINTSIQRCMVKAIALHGLGLSLYAGEDLPPSGKPKEEVITFAEVADKISKVDNHPHLVNLWKKYSDQFEGEDKKELQNLCGIRKKELSE